MKFVFSASLGLIFFLGTPMASLAETGDDAYVKPINYTLEQPFGGQKVITNLAHYIQTLYQFALGLVGIIAVVLIMFGGLRWVSAAGNEQTITDAKEIITSAVTGLIIALLSYTILLFINPQLVKQNFSVFEIPIPSSNGLLWKLKWCTDSPFKGSQCKSHSGQANCEDVICSETGVYNNDQCRGAVCTGDESGASRGCYRDVKNPSSAAACTMQDCGQKIKSCFDTFPDNPVYYSQCVCGYYTDLVKSKLNFSNSYSDWTSAQADILKDLCTEGTAQSSWVQKITASPSTYGYNDSTANLMNIAWNCSLAQCQYQQATGVQTAATDVSMAQAGGYMRAAVTEYKCVSTNQ